MTTTTPKKRWLRADRIVLMAIFCVAGVGFIPVQKIYGNRSVGRK